MKRILDWLGYVGIALLVAAVMLPFWRPEWQRVRWALVIVGIVLVLASLLVYARTVSGAFGRRTARYGLNTAVMVVLLLAVVGLVEAVSFRHNARVDLTENHPNEKPVSISGKDVRKALQEGNEVDPRIMRPSTSRILAAAMKQ